MKRRHMVVNLWKPKEWVGIATGPNCGFAIAYVLLLKGPIQLPYSLCLALSTQPCPTLNASIAIIPTLSNPNNSIHYYFINWCCLFFKPYPKSLSIYITQ